MEPLMSSLMPFAANWQPKGWFPCDGRLLAIAEYSALFSLLGTQYGGDGVQTFGLPNMAGLVDVNGAAVNWYIAAVGIYPSRV